MTTRSRLTRAEYDRRLAHVEKAAELSILLADLRDKATTNATTGSRDERNAWASMAAELSRALNISTKL